MNRAAALLVLSCSCTLIAQSVSPKVGAPVAGAANGKLVLPEKQSVVAAPQALSGQPDALKAVMDKLDVRLFAMQVKQLSAANCPVGMRAQPGSGANMVVTKGPSKDVGNSQQLHLTFANRRSQEIVAMSVTIRGFDATARTLLLDSRSQDSPDLAKTVDLKLNVATGRKTETDVTLRSFASITRVDLESVEYADGTNWKATGLQSCHIVPDRFVLVGAR
jgi:hypothetical protein